MKAVLIAVLLGGSGAARAGAPERALVPERVEVRAEGGVAVLPAAPGSSAPSTWAVGGAERGLEPSASAAAAASQAATLAPSLAPSQAPVSAVDRLDEILVSAGGPEAFIRSADHRSAYFQLAEEYFGARRFQRESFDAILGQLQPMLDDTPGLRDRLMERSALGEPYSLTLSRGSSGREVDGELWRPYLERLLADLRSTAEAAQTPHGRAAARVLAELDSDRRSFALLRSERADAIFEAFEAARARIAADRDGYQDLELRMLPRRAQLEGDKRMFPQAVLITRSGATTPAGKAQAGTYWFKPAPRPFHTIFAGIAAKECFGGACEHLASLTPRRWALSALSGSRFHFLEKDAAFRGVVRGVPRVAPGGAAFLAYEYLAQDLGNTFLTMDADSGAVTVGRLFDLWFEKLSADLRGPWKGVIKAANSEMRNGGVVYFVLQSTRYAMGEPLGSARGFRHWDRQMLAALDASPTVRKIDAALAAQQAAFPEMISDTELGDPDAQVRLLSRSQSDLRRIGE